MINYAILEQLRQYYAMITLSLIQIISTQLGVHTTVMDHFTATPLRLIIAGTAGTGKSNLLHRLRLLMGEILKVAASTGVVSFIIDGTTLNSYSIFLKRRLDGNRLIQLQQSMSGIIIDEM